MDNMAAGLASGIILPMLVFAIYFSIHDPALYLADVINRLYGSGVLANYISLCTISNLLAFFIFLKFNAERAARGVLGATILYAFAILMLKLT